MKKLRTFAVFCLVAVLLGGIGVYANTTYGTESDPLITMSYLNSVLKPELEQKYNQQTKDSIAALETRVEEATGGGYVAVTINANQTMTCKAGCEFLARSGGALVTSGILDVTEGKAADANAWLMQHHLYMAINDGAAVKADSTTTLMVRGEYTIS